MANIEDLISKYKSENSLTKNEKITKLSEETPDLRDTVDEEMLARLWELKTQVHNIKRYGDELKKVKARKPEKQADKNLIEYYRQKTSKKSTAFSIIGMVLGILAVVGFVVLCVLDAKKGWDIFYPVNEGFTLTYLLKVLAIGIIGGAITIFLMMLLGVLIDMLVDAICRGTYDARHRKEFLKAQEQDRLAEEDYLARFTANKKRDEEDYTQKLVYATQFVESFSEVPAVFKTEEQIDHFYEYIDYIMKSKYTYEYALKVYTNFYENERKFDLYYYTLFRTIKPYSKDESKKIVSTLGSGATKVYKLLGTMNEKKIVEIFKPVVECTVLNGLGANEKRIKAIKTKKDAQAFLDETNRISSYCEYYVKKRLEN